MCNSLLISSDYKSLYLIGKRDEDRLFINGNGILLSVLGNGITGCEVPAQLRTHVASLTRGEDPFFEMDVSDAKKNHVSVSYNEENSAVFVIGVTDIDVSLPTNDPTTIKPDNILTKAVRLKEDNTTGLASKKVIYVHTEIAPEGGNEVSTGGNIRRGVASKTLKFYLLDVNSDPS